MERLIRNTCDSAILTTMHPRSAMTIITQELCNDGAVSLTYICISMHLWVEGLIYQRTSYTLVEVEKNLPTMGLPAGIKATPVC